MNNEPEVIEPLRELKTCPFCGGMLKCEKCEKCEKCQHECIKWYQISVHTYYLLCTNCRVILEKSQTIPSLGIGKIIRRRDNDTC